MAKKTMIILNCIIVVETVSMFFLNTLLASLFLFIGIIGNFIIYSNSKQYNTKTEIDLVKAAKNDSLILTEKNTIYSKNFSGVYGEFKQIAVSIFL
jgi:hypothetical protein